jgi:hypothetical protein
MATPPAPRYAKDPIALAKLRREKAFSSPAPKVEVKSKPVSYNRFGMGKIDRTDADPATRVFGEVVKAVLPDPATLKRAAMDPAGTAKGAVEIASLASPIANAYRSYKFLSGDGVSVTGADMSDVEQALEVGGLIPTGKVGTISAKFGAKIIPRVVDDIAAVGGARLPAPTPSRPALVDVADLLARVPVSKKVGGRGTPRAEQTPELAAVLSSKQKLAQRAATNQGEKLKYDLTYTFYDRIRQIDKRAKAIDPNARVLQPPTQSKRAYNIYKDEMKRIIRDAERDFPDFDRTDLELSHITPLEQGGSNSWSNLRLMPRELNQDQGTALYSAWRYASMGLVDPNKVAAGTKLGGSKGTRGITGGLAEGIG